VGWDGHVLLEGFQTLSNPTPLVYFAFRRERSIEGNICRLNTTDGLQACLALSKHRGADEICTPNGHH